jgi:tetratricopeptide (TPR) repeat protein
VLGKLYWDLGSRDKGINYLTNAYDIAKMNHFTEKEGRALGFLATSYYDVKEYQLALSYFQQCLAIYDNLPVNSMLVRFTITMGCTYKETGDFTRAIEYLQKGAELSKSIQSQTLFGRALNDLANTYFAMKDADRAVHFYEMSLTLRKQLE